MKILFKYPSRSRPANFFRGIKSIQDNLSNKVDYKIYATLDENDSTMNNDEVKGWMLNIDNLEYTFGSSKSKIDACNRDMYKITNEYNWDIVILMSDDMIFTAKGFDDIIRQDMIDSHPTLDGVLHYPDGNRDDLITMSILGRMYFERFRYLYHPDYKSVYCDNEFTDVAKMLGKYAYFDKKILAHLHPAYGKGDFDRLYKNNESRELYSHDETIYNNRKENNFA